MAAIVIPDAAHAAIGRMEVRGKGTVTAEHVRKFAVAIDDPDPVYFDAAAARAAGFRDIVGPPLFASSVTRPLPFRAELLNDGQYRDLAPPGLNHLQTMLAGQSWEFARPAVVGDELEEAYGVRSITEREGRNGTLIFVEQESVIRTTAGEAIERGINLLMLREPPPPMPPAPAGIAPIAEGPATTRLPDGLIKRPDMIQLFMFAAANWAVHRIHWDTPYAQSEGVPLPVLPGTMVASYLAQAATPAAADRMRLKRLAVRYKASAFPGDILACRRLAGEDAGNLVLEAANQHGVAVVTGEAGFG